MRNFIDVHNHHAGVFDTRYGKVIDFHNPTADMICEKDIAHALGHICRFGGHAMGFYTVAEHSILVAALAPDELKLEALLHDAAEAYLGDVIKPLKVIIGDVYAQLEDSFMKAIIEKFNLDPLKLAAVKNYDVQALELEHEAYIKDCINTHGAIYSMVESEIGQAYYPFEIPKYFGQLLKEYQKERILSK